MTEGTEREGGGGQHIKTTREQRGVGLRNEQSHLPAVGGCAKVVRKECESIGVATQQKWEPEWLLQTCSAPRTAPLISLTGCSSNRKLDATSWWFVMDLDSNEGNKFISLPPMYCAHITSPSTTKKNPLKSCYSFWRNSHCRLGIEIERKNLVCLLDLW